MELFWSVYIASLVVAWILSFILWRTLKRPYPINWKIPAGADRYTWYRDRFFPALDGGVCLPPEVFFERAKAGDWKTNLIGGVLFPGLSMRLRWEDETSGHRYYTT
ncbi:MAG: hypothetical protein HYS44_03165, partial [Candidatus Niyogibacteria bacterium]|nr:hypothetical protein [Candidatus Niyogibacteria bacterium]